MSRRPREGRKPGRNKNGVVDQRKGNRLRQQAAFRARSNGLPNMKQRLAKEVAVPRTYNARVLAIVCPTCGETGECRKLISHPRYKADTNYQEWVVERKLGRVLEQPHQDRWEAATFPASVNPNNQPEGVSMSEQNIEKVEGDVNVETPAEEPTPTEQPAEGDSNDAPAEGGDTSGDEAQQDTGALQE